MSERVSPLRSRMTEDMTVRNLSATTRTSYIHNIKKFGQFFGRSPDCLGLEDVSRPPGSLGVARRCLDDAQPSRVVTALFLWRHPGRCRHRRHRLNAFTLPPA